MLVAQRLAPQAEVAKPVLQKAADVVEEGAWVIEQETEYADAEFAYMWGRQAPLGYTPARVIGETLTRVKNGAALTSDGAGGIVEFDAVLKNLWDEGVLLQREAFESMTRSVQ